MLIYQMKQGVCMAFATFIYELFIRALVFCRHAQNLHPQKSLEIFVELDLAFSFASLTA